MKKVLMLSHIATKNLYGGNQMAKTIELKILPNYFNAVVEGKKTFELRLNDRNYIVGDVLILQEFNGYEKTGRSIAVVVTYILKNCGFGLAEGYVILGIEKLHARRKTLQKRICNILYAFALLAIVVCIPLSALLFIVKTCGLTALTVLDCSIPSMLAIACVPILTIAEIIRRGVNNGKD